MCTGTLRLLKLFGVGTKTRLTYKPILRKTSCAVTLSQKREKIVIYALIFFGQLAWDKDIFFGQWNQAAFLFLMQTQRPKLRF